MVKKGIVDLVKMLKNIEGLEDLSMTTNGVYLKGCAQQLKAAGLDRINISLDTLRKERFKAITGFDCFEDVFEGIEKALEVGLAPVKLNVVPMKGTNDDEILDFARLTLKHPLIVRFIEFFHTNKRSNRLAGSLVASIAAKEKIISELGKLEPDLKIKGYGPAKYYSLKDAQGAIGFISGSSNNFCRSCNRIRVDCAGRVSPCLFSGGIYDARSLLQEGSSEEKLVGEIKRIFNLKSRYTKDITVNRRVEMSSLGG
ncbi:MAG: radical SAM protein [Candidatus Omnitrophota bacterium]